MTPLTEKDIEYQRALAAMHSFAIEDIQTNRGGWMTEAQISKLRWRPVIGCFGLLLLVGGLLIVGAIVSAASSPDAGFFVPLIFGLVFAVIGLLIALRWHKEIKENRVERYEGLVLKEEVDKKVNTGPGLIPALIGVLIGAILSGAGVKNYFYKLDNGRKFKVSKAAYNALDCTRPYCVYYSPLSHRMLAVEVLPDTGTAQRVPTFTQFS